MAEHDKGQCSSISSWNRIQKANVFSVKKQQRKKSEEGLLHAPIPVKLPDREQGKWRRSASDPIVSRKTVFFFTKWSLTRTSVDEVLFGCFSTDSASVRDLRWNREDPEAAVLSVPRFSERLLDRRNYPVDATR